MPNYVCLYVYTYVWYVVTDYWIVRYDCDCCLKLALRLLVIWVLISNFTLKEILLYLQPLYRRFQSRMTDSVGVFRARPTSVFCIQLLKKLFEELPIIGILSKMVLNDNSVIEAMKSFLKISRSELTLKYRPCHSCIKLKHTT